MKIEQEYEHVAIDGDSDILKEHPQNPNKGNEQAIGESIVENGWYGAVVAQRSTGYILAGNHRFRAATKAGAKEIPVIWRDVDDETAIKIMLADNQTARLAEMDDALLDELFEGLETLTGTGYGLAAVDEEESREEAPEEASDGEEDDIPDDVYVPNYGVMVVCESEEHQREIYEKLGKLKDASKQPLKLRVVAV